MRVILVGGGRTLYFLGRTFRAKGHQVTIINRNPAECARLARELEGATIVQGEGSERRILEEAGARAANVVLAATPSDPDNLVICQLAQTKFGVPRAVALVNDPENQGIFRQLGIDAISTSLTVASLIEQRAALDQVIELIPAGEGKVLISEITLDAQAPAVGRRLAELGLPRDALIAAVMRGEETLIPRGDTTLQGGDRVLLVKLATAREETLRVLVGPGE